MAMGVDLEAMGVDLGHASGFRDHGSGRGPRKYITVVFPTPGT
jgi:hypothetical protein